MAIFSASVAEIALWVFYSIGVCNSAGSSSTIFLESAIAELCDTDTTVNWCCNCCTCFLNAWTSLSAPVSVAFLVGFDFVSVVKFCRFFC